MWAVPGMAASACCHPAALSCPAGCGVTMGLCMGRRGALLTGEILGGLVGASVLLCAWGEAERGWESEEGGMFRAALPGIQSLRGGERRGGIMLSGAREKEQSLILSPFLLSSL